MKNEAFLTIFDRKRVNFVSKCLDFWKVDVLKYGDFVSKVIHIIYAKKMTFLIKKKSFFAQKQVFFALIINVKDGNVHDF